ncbi:MAG TPA: RagB/SusD family nutrient uptake outer membrane protein [Gemmatimonadaceae bacterium]|nr:RagB/SusD family nutrient uptake outer membrane protein [Gemmatimonadaceae bacterium]
MTTTMSRMARAMWIAAALIGAGCNNFNIQDPNQPLLNSITQNPNRANMATFAAGLFDYSRQDMENFIWRVGSMGREGINLSGNNQPDYGEPYYGPLNPSEFGGALWSRPYTEIRNANVYIDAVPKTPDLNAQDKSASLGFGQTLKALAFLYIVETRAQLGAPIDVDRPVTSAPAPFVSEDSVYATIIHTLDSARTNLAAAGSSFPFSVPPGYTTFGFNTPQGFSLFVSALEAKAWVLRATDLTKCGGTPATCYTAALAALGTSFISTAPSDFTAGTYFDFSTGPGDVQNGLSEPLTGPIYFSLIENINDAQKQTDGTTIDARALAKIDSIPVGQPPQILGGIPIQGIYKFSVYFTQGQANANASIPIIRDEELILLRAEAELGLGQLTLAESDINIIRQNSGNLPALAAGASASTLLTELLYNRRYSLLWEQGTRWIDARRYGVLSTIPAEPIAPTAWPQQGNVPPVMPIPQNECEARGLGTTCDPLGT